MNTKVFLVLLILIYSVKAYSQKSWHGRLYFNLIDTSGHIITPEDVQKQNIRFYSRFNTLDYLLYDSDNKCFVYDSHNITVGRSFFVESGNKMLKVDFPATGDVSLFITTPISINDLKYDFYHLINPMIDERRNEEVKKAGNYRIIYLPADSAVIDITDITEDKGRLVKFNYTADMHP